MKVNNFFNIFAKFADKYLFYKSKESEPIMNGVLSASKLMKASQVRRLCAEVRSNREQLFKESEKRKRKLYEMNRKVSNRREVS